MSQLDIFSFLDKGNSGKTNDIAWIPVSQLQPHPDNPRLIYRDDLIDTIAQSIQDGGFQPCYALLVRPLNGSYQIISGHTRTKAALKAGIDSLPCWIKEMDDKTALAELRKANRQGELSYRERAFHTFCSAKPSQGKKGEKLDDGTFETIEAYAKDQGIPRKTASDEYKVGELNEELRRTSAEVYERVNQYEANTGRSLGSHQLAISKAPRQYWQQLTELLIQNEWSVKQTEAIVNAIKEVDIPEHFQFWLNPDKAIKETIAEWLRNGIARTPRDIKNWVEAAQEALDNLPPPETIAIIENDELVPTLFDLKSQFLNGLLDLNKDAKKPSKTNIDQLAKKLVRNIEKLKEESQRWEIQKAEGEKLRQLQEEDRIRKEKLALEYAPTGILGDCEEALPTLAREAHGSFDLVLTDPPYLLSNGGITARGSEQVSVNKNFEDSSASISPETWMPWCLQLLKPGGVLVFTCTEHLGISVSRVKGLGFEFLERLFWVKRSAPPRLTPTGHRACIEEIWVLKKPGESHFFNYEYLKEKYWADKQPSNYLEFEQCSGNEREGWHDTQKPLKLWSYLLEAYSAEDAKVLDPFSGTGTTAVVSKANRRKCTWIEKKQDFFELSNDRIEKSPFFWEVQ